MARNLRIRNNKMPVPLIGAGAAAAAIGTAARVATKKLASRAVGGIAGIGAKTVNPVYRMNASSAKKQVAGYAAGLAATTAWIGSEMYEAEKRRKKANKR
jgi:hypothetical protein